MLIWEMGIDEGTDCILVVGGVIPMSLGTLRSMGILQPVHTERGSEYLVRCPIDTTTTTTTTNYAPPSPTTVEFSPRSSCPSSSYTDQVICSTSVFHWLQRSVTKIAEHLGIYLSHEPSSPIRSPPIGGQTLLLGPRILLLFLLTMRLLLLLRALHFDYCTATFLFSFLY